MSTTTDKVAPGKGDPTTLTGGPQGFFFVGLTEDAPFDTINVPTCILPGGVRGTAPCVPKKSARLLPDGRGGLVHHEGGRIGDHVKLYPVEVEAFKKYCRTHVFRRTSTYMVKQADGSETAHWRAEIEALEAGPSAIRILGDEAGIQSELLSKYVWIVPAQMSMDGTPIESGRQRTIAELDGEATAAEKQKQEKPPGGK